MSAPTKNLGPEIRLLVCLVCNTIEELPPFEGRPEDDTLLDIAAERHQGADGPHSGHLIRVPIKAWASPAWRKQIIEQIRRGTGGISELDPDFYDTRSNFGEDAMRCFNLHSRPKGQCPDYCSDSKRLLPKTKSERRDVGLPDPRDAPGPKQYLCHFCPVHVFNVTKHRTLGGMYE